MYVIDLSHAASGVDVFRRSCGGRLLRIRFSVGEWGVLHAWRGRSVEAFTLVIFFVVCWHGSVVVFRV